MKVVIENGELVIREPLGAPKVSSSGKTMVVASSHGNKSTECDIDGKTLIVGFNAYFKP